MYRSMAELMKYKASLQDNICVLVQNKEYLETHAVKLKDEFSTSRQM
jgi:hypothetical protein